MVLGLAAARQVVDLVLALSGSTESEVWQGSLSPDNAAAVGMSLGLLCVQVRALRTVIRFLDSASYP